MNGRVNRNRYTKVMHIVKVFCAIGTMVVLALFYVWQHVQSVQLGYEIKGQERVIMKLQEQNRSLQMEFAFQKMPSRILARVEDNNLQLGLPNRWHMVKVKMDPVLYPDEFMGIDWDSGSLRLNPIIRVSKKTNPDIL
ncbi:MAG: hypothetical protein Q8Q33_01965 [Chlamydiota bacterium]|nr:hypothetical protein [Chlamydiota bacterium]